MLRFPVTTIVLTVLLSTAALAQTPQVGKPTLRDRIAAMQAHSAAKPLPATSKMVPPAQTGGAQTQQPRTAKSLACSRSADTNGLHGKPRKSYMEKCKRA